MPSLLKWIIAFAIGLALVGLGWQFPAVLKSLHILLCFVLILVVLLQSGKAADLAGAFGGAGSQTAFGPRGAATALSKATTWCAVMFMLTSLAMFLRGPQTQTGSRSLLEQTQPMAPAPSAPPAQQPSPPPGQQPAPQQQQPQTPPPKQ